MAYLVTIKVNRPMESEWKYFTVSEEVAEAYVAKCQKEYHMESFSIEKTTMSLKEFLEKPY